MRQDFGGRKGGRDCCGRWIGGRFTLLRRPGAVVKAGAWGTVGCGVQEAGEGTGGVVLEIGTFALRGVGCLGGGGGCGLFNGEGLCGFGGGQVIGGFVLGLVSSVLVWHGDREGLACLHGRAVVTLLIIL